MSTPKDKHSLLPGARLDNYVIEKTLGGGGFSIVYLARDINDNSLVAIKEYMPHRLARRGEDGASVLTTPGNGNSENFTFGRRMFFQEASTLANIRHPNIVHVINFFSANDTVYMVMTYEDGVNLQDYIKRHRGKLSEKFLRTVFIPLLDGVQCLHEQGLLHLDIKPANIFLRPGGSPLLLDFGAVHRMRTSRRYLPSQVITPGFAPYEQLTPGGYVGPWSDIYAIGATMRACMDGGTPQYADERRNKDNLKPAREQYRKHYSASLLAAIDWAMEIDPVLRPQNVVQLLEALQKKDDPDDSNPRGGSFFNKLVRDFSLPWSKD